MKRNQIILSKWKYSVPSSPVWVNLKTEEVEDVVFQLVEYLDDGEPEEVEAVNIILDKIIELPTKVEIQNEEDIITDTKVKEELTELLSEVLDRMEIDYTPETFDSLSTTNYWVQYIQSNQIIER
jgi:hypothetical protein